MTTEGQTVHAKVESLFTQSVVGNTCKESPSSDLDPNLFRTEDRKMRPVRKRSSSKKSSSPEIEGVRSVLALKNAEKIGKLSQVDPCNS